MKNINSKKDIEVERKSTFLLGSFSLSFGTIIAFLILFNYTGIHYIGFSIVLIGTSIIFFSRVSYWDLKEVILYGKGMEAKE